ncbi:MAG: DNA alkylation repair protein [Acidobacteriota bacterium]
MATTAVKILAELEAEGTAQNRKVYARHGVGENMYGVSYATLGKLKKRIKVDQELAEALWASGNHDARVLATMVADPQAIRSTQLDTWSKDLDNYVLTDAFASLAAKTPFVRTKFAKWSRSRNESIGQAGWLQLCSLARSDEELDDSFFEEQLQTIESEIHQRKDRVRYAMNSALIQIGARNTALKRQAIAAAQRIGAVEVDHGETGCKTPEAVGYIEKMWARQAQLAAKKNAKKAKTKKR